MNTRQAFIHTMRAMVDFKTIFVASDLFWSEIYDKIERGIQVDFQYLTIYRTIKAMDTIRNDPIVLKEREDAKLRRFLLDMIERRAIGDKITVLCVSAREIDFIQSNFHSLFDQVRQLCLSNIDLDRFNDGSINFKVANDHNLREIRLENDGKFSLMGASRDHRVFMTSAVIHKQFIKPFSFYQDMIDQYDCDKSISEFVTMSEMQLKHKNEQDRINDYKKNLSNSINWALGD